MGEIKINHSGFAIDGKVMKSSKLTVGHEFSCGCVCESCLNENNIAVLECKHGNKMTIEKQ